MDLINKYFKVLDDGFIALKGYMGSDLDIEQAARVSYGKGTRKVSDTRSLLRYLMRHHHTTPFEMSELTFHIRLPIYVVRQWHRHRTWSYNEYSGRYSEMIDSMEKTSEWRSQSGTNKQGSGDKISDEWADGFEKMEVFGTVGDFLSGQEKELHETLTEAYKMRLSIGVAKEQARKDLPVSNYTEMYAKTDLKNLMHFMSLRCDSHAQLEIRLYANIIAGIVKELFPITFEAWYDYAFTASNWTRLDKTLLALLLSNCGSSFHDFKGDDKIDKMAEEIGMSKRELDEFWEKYMGYPEDNFSLDNIKEYNEKITQDS